MKICPSCRAPCWEAHRHCPACGEDISRVATREGDPYVGANIAGRYRLLELLGSGVMGRVYRARHLGLETDVAVKLVNPDVAADPVTALRFHQEARATSRLRHPNAVGILDFGQTDTGLLFLVMELLRGRTLARILHEEGALPVRRVVELLSQGLAALDAAHAAGVIHRDFKPENLFVEQLRSGGEHVKVLDFGMAKLLGHAEGVADPGLTASGVVCGTPDYMSPEQIRGDALDARSDVYAAGVVLYEMLTGACPFGGPLLEVLRQHVHMPPMPPGLRQRDPPIPAAVEAVCLQALAKARDQRFPSAEAMRRALVEALHEDPRRCPTCGEELTIRARFCPTCGAAIEPPGLPTPTPLSALLSDGDAPSAAAVESVASLNGRPLPWVGREAERAALEAHDRGLLVVIGPPGSGRSRLVDEWRAGLEERVLVMRPDPSGAQQSGWPIRRALAEQLGIREQPTAEELESAASLRTDHFGLRELFGLNEPCEPTEMELRRREALAAVLSTLRGVVHLGPATLVCEDLDRYDRLSAEVVEQLAAEPAGLRIVITTTQQRGEFGPSPTVTLGPLPPSALRELGVDGDGHALNDALPISVETLLRARAEAAGEPSLEGRLARLAPIERSVLLAVVVAGVEADLQLLAAVLPDADLRLAIDPLVRHGFARLGEGRIELPSPTLRDRIYQGIERSERRALHRAWRAVLASHGAGAMLLAHHDWQADAALAAPPAMERAAEAAELAHDGAGVVRWRTRALDRARVGGGASERVRLAIALGDALLTVGDLAHAEVAISEALERIGPLERSGHPERSGHEDRAALEPSLAALARRGLGRIALARNLPERAGDQLTKALDLAKREGAGALVGELALELGQLWLAHGRPDEARALLDDGLRFADSPSLRWRLLMAAAASAHASCHDEDTLRVGSEALLAAMLVSPSAVASVRMLLATACQSKGDLASASAHRRAALESLGRAGDRKTTSELLLATAHLDARTPEMAARWLRLAGDLALQIGWHEGVARARETLRRVESTG